MHCLSCKIQVPPSFTKAIMDNVCPACGKELLSGDEFKELIRIKTILSESGLEEGLSISVSAAISTKFDLVLKSERKTPKGLGIEKDFGLSEEEKAKLKALYIARKQKEEPDLSEQEEKEIIDNWGLEQGDFATSATLKATSGTGNKNLIDPQMAELFSEAMFDENSDIMAPTNFKPSLMKPANIERLARAEALKSDPSKFRIHRAE